MNKKGLSDYKNSAKNALSSELQSIIVEKAYKFDVAFFQNEYFATALCDLNNVKEISANTQMGELLGWVASAYESAQLSSDKK